MNRQIFFRIAVLVLILGVLFPMIPGSYAASLYTVKTSSTTTLAPGITQTIRTLSYGDGTNSVTCYLATADLNRGDVVVLNGYKDNAPAYNGCSTVTVDQQIIASNKVHQDPNDARYIENYRVVAGCNGGFFNIPGITGIAGFKGALVMEGVQYWEYDNRPFLAILKDGSVVVGHGASDWNKYREHMQEAIGGNVLLVKNGKNNTGNVNLDAAFVGQENDGLGTKRHPRTCAGVTQDGKVVMLVIDAQTTATAGTRGGATLNEAAQMLIDAGCYYAINMDGGGSSTYMTMAEGATTPTLVNKPSGGSMRAICGSLLFASTAPSDHLSFEFDGTGADRYMTGLYCKRNYDLPGYWATGLSGTGAGDTAPTVNTSTGLMTVNLTRREGSHSTYIALGDMNGTFDQAKDTNAVSLSYVPKEAELLRIRLKLKDAKRYSATDTPFVGFSYLSGDTKTWSGNLCQLPIPDAYLDGGDREDTFLTLTVDLTNSKLRDCSRINNIMLQIGYLREGGVFIDQIYLGPKSGSKLQFDFAEDPNKSSFFHDPAYNYLNFDREMYWHKGPEISSMDINHGAMTLKVDNACANLHEAYVETVLSHKNPVQPLRYTPKAGDVIRVRYRVESYDATLNATTYGASQKPTMTVYGFHDRQYVYKNPAPVTLTTSGRSYTVAQWTVPTEWTGYDISMLHVTLRYFQNSTIKIDSIYVGPKDQAAFYDRMYIGFNNAATDRTRYGSAIYGGMNMDKVGSWSVGTEYKPPVISGGAMKLTPNTGYDGYGYVHSGSQTGAYPLSFVPTGENYLQVRFKIDNGVARNLYADKNGIGRFVLYYGNASVGARSSFVYHEFKVADVSGKGWITITYRIKDMATSGSNMTALTEITSLSPCFNWVASASGKTVALYLDYIYVGPRSGLPNPQYTVTFKDGNGAILMTQTVYKGQSVAYSGPSPKKNADANYHYTFKGWDKSAANITADTVITAQFTAVAHSYTYTSVDDTSHRASCSCGYSKVITHSLTYTSVDGTNHRVSCSCGYSKLAAHSFTYSSTGDHNKHKRSCSCGYSDTTEGHQYSFAKYSASQHTRTCAKCGFVDQAAHIFTYTSTGSAQHKRYCKWCGYEDTVDHVWDKGVVAVAPSYTEAGLKRYTCTACNATKTEAMPKLSDSLYFDYSNTSADQLRYASAIYGKINFDLGTWSWSGRIEKPVIDNTAGTLSVTMLPDAASYSIYVQSSNSLQADMKLQYVPGKAEYVQYRIKLENFTSYETPIVGLFYYQDTTAPNGAGIQMASASRYILASEDLTSGSYITVTQPVTDAFRACKNISAIRLDVAGVKSISNQQLGKLTVDYIYVGPKSDLPVQDSLLFNFTNTSEDQSHYGRKQYSSLNFDTPVCWYHRQANMEPVTIDSAAGTLTATLLPSPPNGEHYIQPSGSSTVSTMPLIYVPRQGDYFQMRLRIDNAALYDSNKALRLGIYFYNGSQWICEYGIYDKSVIGSGYFTVTIPLSTAFTSIKEISVFRPWFDNITNASGKTATFTIDYIAIGQGSFLPYAPCIVKFVDGNGTVLDTQTVGKGDAVSYRGPTPTRAYDGTHHYTFRSWDRTQTNITADTTITAQFTATAHSYSYSKVDGTNHRATCSCGYSKLVSHSWNSGTVTTQSTCTATGLKSYTCTGCKATKTETVAAKGHTVVTDKAIAPTCTTAGQTEGSHCSVCNAVIVAQQTVPATGHAPVCAPKDGDTHTVTCANCRLSETAPHSYTDGLCICGQVEVKEPVKDPTLKLNHSLNLASDISVNLVIHKSLLEGFDMDTVYIESTVDTYEGNEKTGTAVLRIKPVEKQNYYYFTLNGLTAVKMNDNISSVLYGTKDGQPYYSPVDKYSIATYAYAQLVKRDVDESLKILCADLLRYGAKAQIFKAYRTDSLADSLMTEEQNAYLSDIDAVTFGSNNKELADLANPTITWTGKTLSMETKVVIRFVFNTSNYTGSMEDLSLRLSYQNTAGETVNVTLTEITEYHAASNNYSFDFAGLRAADLRSVVSAAIYAGDTQVSTTTMYSADSYGNNKTGDLLKVCQALMAYSDAAKAYFTK